MEFSDQIDDPLLGWREAADRAGMTETQLRSQHRYGCGPAYVKRSYKSVLFYTSDIDKWIDSWRAKRVSR